MSVSLEPGERVVETVDDVAYESMEGAEKSWKRLMYSDKGVLRLTTRRLIFTGEKYTIGIPNIVDMGWKKHKGPMVDFIRVDFTDDEGKPDSALFAWWKGKWWQSVGKATEELFQKILDWRENVLKEKRREPKKEETPPEPRPVPKLKPAPPLRRFDRELLGYITEHGGEISVSGASKELGASKQEIKAALGRLKRAGKLEEE